MKVVGEKNMLNRSNRVINRKSRVLKCKGEFGEIGKLSKYRKVENYPNGKNKLILSHLLLKMILFSVRIEICHTLTYIIPWISIKVYRINYFR